MDKTLYEFSFFDQQKRVVIGKNRHIDRVSLLEFSQKRLVQRNDNFLKQIVFLVFRIPHQMIFPGDYGIARIHSIRVSPVKRLHRPFQ